MNIDLHVHTSRYSACSTIRPEDLAGLADRRGLDGVVITEHNALWGREERQALRVRSRGLRLFWGIEVNAASGMHYLAYYDPDRGTLQFEMNMDDAELVTRVHALGGVVVPAHIYRYATADTRPVETLAIDAVESMSQNIDTACGRKCADLAQRRGLPLVAGGDTHDLDVLGRYYTAFDVDIADERGLVAALQAGRFRPCRVV